MVLSDIAVKKLEILTQAIPQARQIAVLSDPARPSHELVVKAVERAGVKLGLRLIVVPAQTENNFAGAFSTMSRQGAAGLLIVASPRFTTHRTLLAELTLKHRLPAMVGSKAEVQAGELVSYGADLDDLFRRSASYILTRSSRAPSRPTYPSSNPPSSSW